MPYEGNLGLGEAIILKKKKKHSKKKARIKAMKLHIIWVELHNI
jgi:hypothetical protein